MLFAGARLVGNTVSLWQLGNRSANELKVLEALPRHAQMVTFRALHCPPPTPWTFDRWTHLSGYAVARRHAFLYGLVSVGLSLALGWAAAAAFQRRL